MAAKKLLFILFSFIMFGSANAVQRLVDSAQGAIGGAHSPGLIVVTALHGAGSTMLSLAMNKHPCIISLGEPFGGNENLYAPDGMLKEGDRTLFGNHSKPDPKGTYHKLWDKLNHAVGKNVPKVKDLHTKSKNIYDFFQSVRDIACDAYDLPQICGGRCVFSHKLFPDYIYNDFEVAQHYLENADTAVIHLHRNEKDIAAANAVRFGSYGEAKQKRDNDWNAFLRDLGRQAPAGKVWRDIAFEDLFKSGAKAYMEELEPIFRDLDLDRDDQTEPVRIYLEEQFDHKGANHHRR